MFRRAVSGVARHPPSRLVPTAVQPVFPRPQKVINHRPGTPVLAPYPAARLCLLDPRTSVESSRNRERMFASAPKHGLPACDSGKQTPVLLECGGSTFTPQTGGRFPKSSAASAASRSPDRPGTGDSTLKRTSVMRRRRARVALPRTAERSRRKPARSGALRRKILAGAQASGDRARTARGFGRQGEGDVPAKTGQNRPSVGDIYTTPPEDPGIDGGGTVAVNPLQRVSAG